MTNQEIDALVAEKVMGYWVESFVWHGLDGDKTIPSQVWVTDHSRKDEPARKRQDVTINPIPYSSNISAAWEVIERLCELGCYPIIERSGSGRHWIAKDFPKYSFLAEEKTAPLAVCVMALRVVKALPQDSFDSPVDSPQLFDDFIKALEKTPLRNTENI